MTEQLYDRPAEPDWGEGFDDTLLAARRFKQSQNKQMTAFEVVRLVKARHMRFRSFFDSDLNPPEDPRTDDEILWQDWGIDPEPWQHVLHPPPPTDEQETEWMRNYYGHGWWIE